MAADRTVAVIPARYGSTRFPGKPLALIAGRPMVQRVYERADAAAEIDDVLVATDDDRIFAAVEAFGGRAVMTSSDHATGTDRIAEAVTGIDADLVVNVQGDEVLVPPEIIDRLVVAMRSTMADMGTVAVPFGPESSEETDENAVKVVVDKQGFALYFSRAPIPFHRSGGTPVQRLLHWGLYAYRREFLCQFVNWPQGDLERSEMLEQLRALEHCARILVIRAAVQSVSVDVPEDIARVERILRERETE